MIGEADHKRLERMCTRMKRDVLMNAGNARRSGFRRDMKRGNDTFYQCPRTAALGGAQESAALSCNEPGKYLQVSF